VYRSPTHLLDSPKQTAMRPTPLPLLALLIASIAAHAQSKLIVHDPNASFINIPARRAALAGGITDPRLQQAIASAKSCSASPAPPPPPPGQDIPPHYLHDSHGPTNPAEHEAAEPYSKVQRVAALGANRYLLTGDPAEANCVVHILLPWARAHVMLNYDAKAQRQLWYESEWTIESLALSVSVIRGEPSLKPAERDEVIAWLHQAVKKLLDGAPGSITSRNNHFFFRGLAATAVGVISNDNELFQYGLATYATAIGELNPEGSFPLEMARHELAMHYQSFAVEPLVMIAELAARQGYIIFDLEENHHTLADAIGFLNRAIADPTIIKKYASEPQELNFDPGSTALAWLEFWNARNPSPNWAPYLTKPFFDDRLAGSTTLYAAPTKPSPATPAATAPPTPK
jgi:poly(beta-D-mannuronate) lyase